MQWLISLAKIQMVNVQSKFNLHCKCIEMTKEKEKSGTVTVPTHLREAVLGLQAIWGRTG